MGRKEKIRKARAQALAAAKASRKKSCKTKSAATPGPGPFTVQDLLTRAEEAIDTFQVELAIKFCEKALTIDPSSVRVLDTLGSLLLETGDSDKAIECFKQSIDLSPLTGHSKYLYMGQLSEGIVAIDYIKKGIDIMTKLMGCETSGASEASVSREELSTAYCALAEVYLTDCCFSADAGSLCQEAVAKALEWSPSNVEALQVQANCLLSLERTDEAKEVLVKSVLLWLPEEGEGVVPPYWSRVNTAKLLLELGEYETGFRVLEGLLRDDDEVVSVWYLMGWLHTLTKDDDSARFYLDQTLELYSKHNSDEVDILEHTKELLHELGPPPTEVGVATEDTNIDSDNDDCTANMDTT